jgi:hypothetical protein
LDRDERRGVGDDVVVPLVGLGQEFAALRGVEEFMQVAALDPRR